MTEINLIPITETVTCHTDGCENCNIAIEIVTYEGYTVICGPCEQPITDISEV
jgi:hypothetical protein